MTPRFPSIRLLGPVELSSGALRSGRVSTVLSLLALERGDIVSLDRLTNELWVDDERPQSASAALHVYVSRLRRQLEGTGATITTRAPGYQLTAPAHSIDLELFKNRCATVEEALAAQEWETLALLAESARALWRGEAFGGAVSSPILHLERERLLRLANRLDELTATALIELGRPAEAGALALELTQRDPLNDNYWYLRMRAEHAAGNTAVALVTFDEFTRMLADELGLDPGDRLRQFQLELLRSGDESGASTVVPPVAPSPATTATDNVVRRLAEKAALSQAVAQAGIGIGRVVILEGEPGIGKTALAEYAATTALHNGGRVVSARAVDGPGTPPLWLFENVLGDLLDRSGAQVLRGLQDQVAAESPSDSELTRFRLAQAIATAVVQAASSRPVLLVLDDVQWADSASLRALEVLAQQISDHPCSIVITARTGVDRSSTVAESLARITRMSHARSFRLGPFTHDEVAEFLGPGADPRWVDSMLKWSGGNPYFLTEMARNDLRVRDKPLSGASVPASAVDLLQQRLQRLAEPVRATLEVAAVAARRFEVAVVARSLALAPLETLERLGGGVEAGLVLHTAAGWTFAHDLARQAVLESLGPAKRARLHGDIADAIEALYQDDLDEHLDAYADHRFEAAAGGASAAAFEACTKAADRAAERLSFDQAAVHRARALAVLEPGAGTRRLRFETLMSLSEERRLGGDVLGAARCLRQAIDLARRFDDRSMVIRAVALFGGVTLWNWRQFEQVDPPTIALLEELLGDGSASAQTGGSARPNATQRAELLGTLAVELYYGDDRSRGEALAREAVELARALDDPVLLGRALNNQVIADWSPGRDEQRMAALDEAIALVGRGLPLATEAIARMHRSSLHLRRADLDGFIDDTERAAWLVPRLGIPEIEAQLTTQQAGFALLCGDLDAARKLASAAFQQMNPMSLWGAEWIRQVQETSIARVERAAGISPELAPEFVAALVEVASQDAYRTLRWTAVLVLAESGRLDTARSLQARWGLRTLHRRTHWGSQFEWAQAGETSLLLGTPAASEVYAALLPHEHELVVIGTGLAVWGTVADLLARLATAMGQNDRAMAHAEVARRITVTLEEALGGEPRWPGSGVGHA